MKADGYAVQELAVVVRNLYEITRRPTDLDQNATISSMRNIVLSKISLIFNYIMKDFACVQSVKSRTCMRKYLT